MRLLKRTHLLADALIGWVAVLLFLAGSAGATGTVNLAWSAGDESDIAGYKVLYGTASGSYTQQQSTGISPSATLTGLTPGSTYYVAVQAFTASELSSPLSEEISFTVPQVTVPEISVEHPSGALLADGQSTVNLGDVSIQSSTSRSLTIRNLGSAALTGLSLALNGADASSFGISGSVPPALPPQGALSITSLAPGASTTFEVIFKPTSGGTKNAAVHLTSNDADENPFDIALIGNGLAIPQITVAKANGTSLINGATLSHGSVNLGATSTSQVITLRNSGSGNLTGIAISVDGSNPADFLIETPGTSTLVPGSSADFRITFMPKAAGVRTAAIHIASSDANRSPFHLLLAGTGIANPEIAITLDDSGSLADGVSLATFGSVNMGATSTARTFTISNSGSASLTGLALTADGRASDFSISGLTTTTLAPGASTRFTVTFKPTAAGIRSAALHITSNDADENPFDIRLEGTGVAVPEIAITRAGNTELTDSSSTLDSGKVNLGSSGGAQSLTIKNLGTANLSGLSISIDGANASDFTASTLAGSSLTPNADTTFSITFTPSAAESRSAVLHITSNDADENPFDIKLEGIGGTVPVIAIGQIDGSWLAHGETGRDLGGVTLGATSTAQIITVKNIGTAPLSGLRWVSSGAQGADFIIAAPAQSTLAPGESTSFPVTFKPSTAGQRGAVLQFFSDVQTESAFSLILSGTGIAVPDIFVPNIVVTPAAGGALRLSEGSSSFGSANIGSKTTFRSFIIRNAGSADLTNLALSISGIHASNFRAGALAKTSLAPGASFTFKVIFLPSAAGTRTATLRIASNDPDENPFEIALSGNAIPVPEIAIQIKGGPNLTDDAAFINFGTVARSRASAKKTLIITNTGSAPLSGLTLLKNGLNRPDFTVSNLRVTRLAAGASTTVSLTFKPTTGGTRWAAVHIFSDDADEKSFDIVLTGKNKAASGSKKSAPFRTAAAATAAVPATGSIEVIDGKKYRTLTATWPRGQRDFSRHAEVSSDLLTWFSGRRHTTVLLSDSTTLKVRDNTPISQNDKRHIRLEK